MKKNILIIAIFVVCNLLLSNMFDVSFEEIATGLTEGLTGIERSSAAWGDYDNDGDQDLLITGSRKGTNYSNAITMLYRNDGGNNFSEVDHNIPQTLGRFNWGDYDNDGDLDIALTGLTLNNEKITKIYRNNGGVFTDIGAELEILMASNTSNVAWGDYDNDGDLDILLTGSNPGKEKNIATTKLYKNDSGNFSDSGIELPGMEKATTKWGDYDNDGDLDILMTGYDGSYHVSKILKNESGQFTEIPLRSPLSDDHSYYIAEWGDYDNDGDLDVLLSGDLKIVYRNDGSDTFENINVGYAHVADDQGTVSEVDFEDVTWGDYDNDGKLDILFTGRRDGLSTWVYSAVLYTVNNSFDKIYSCYSIPNVSNHWANNSGEYPDTITSLGLGSVTNCDYDNDGYLDFWINGFDPNHTQYGTVSKIYKNNSSAVANTQPIAPANLYSSIDGNEVTVHWNKTTDADQPFVDGENGLSYNLYIGTSSGAYDVISPNSDISTGYRKVSAIGNVNQNTSWTIKDLPDGIYYYGVQAIDHSFTGSEFSGENIFVKGEYTLPEDKIISLAADCEIRALKGAHIFLENNSLEVNGIFYIEESVRINAQIGSELIIGAFSSLITLIEPDYSEFTPDNYIEMTGNNWKGITCEPFSNVILNRTKISGAEYALKGIPKDVTGTIDDESSCIVEQCEIRDCENGINLLAYQNSLIKNNSFNGIDMGAAVSLIQSSGEIIGNNIDNYNKGVRITSCSPTVLGNTITNNTHNGVYITGMNSYPRLRDHINMIDPVINTELNNTIANNGEVLLDGGVIGYILLPSQIAVGYGAHIYLSEGRNDIYSTYPGIPCVSASGSSPDINIYARNNYWGSSNVTDDFFRISGAYTFNYVPFSETPFGSNPVTSPSPETDTKSWKLLQKGLEAEFNGNYEKAIKIYEKLIDKYPESEEALVAYTKLPDSYNSEGLDLEPLISLYDEQLASEDTRINKKFFKEMKVATHLKGKKYDEAIAISEEMILEAETEEEVTLCEIDIAIANMMKDHSNKGGSKSTKDHSKTLNDLLAKLDGDNKGETTSIGNGELIMDDFTLEQNYPNPFNPVTQIRFSLAKTSEVKLTVYNLNGQLVSELINEVVNAGMHAVNFDGNNLNSGMYFYTLEANGMSITKKMVLTK